MEKRKSSINIKNMSKDSLNHNHREYTPSYAISDASENEYYCYDEDGQLSMSSEYWKKEQYEEVEKYLQEQYTKTTKQKAQSNTQYFKEAVINTDTHVNQDHFNDIVKMLKNKYNVTVTDIAHHKDEGKILDDGTKHINYHAHIIFINADLETGKTIKWDKTKLRNLQTDIAEVLQMDRGIDKRISKVERMEHKQYKQHIQQINELKAKNKELQKELNETKKVLTLTKIVNNNLQKQKNELVELFESLGLNEIKQQTSDTKKIKKLLLEKLAREYNEERNKLKETKQATQQQYQSLKIENEQKKELINEAFKKQLTNNVSNNNITNKNKNNKGWERDL